MTHTLAIDFGTTNSVVTRWNAQTASPEFVVIDGLNSGPAGSTRFLIPTLLYVLDGQSGEVLIGQAVRTHDLERPTDQRLFRTFKRAIIAAHPLESRLIDGALWSEHDAGQHFIRQLINQLPYPTTEIDSLVVTVPVGSLDTYTHWLNRVLPPPLPARTRIIDESTSAALGYSVTQPRAIVLIVDFGGGSLDVSLVRLPDDLSTTGRSLKHWLTRGRHHDQAAQVIAKHGINLGGSDIDRWLLSHLLEQAGRTHHDVSHHCPTLSAACERAKITLSTDNTTTIDWQTDSGEPFSTTIHRSEMEALMTDKGFFTALRQTIDHVLTAARRSGIYLEDVQHIFMVGGTSLVPAVQDTLHTIFPRTSLRVDKPFTAVAEGALRVAVGLDLDDRLAHSYGLRCLDADTGQHDYDEIIPIGTRYPTRKAVTVQLEAAHPDQQAIELVIGQISAGATARHIIPVNAHDPLTVPLTTSDNSQLQASFSIDRHRQLRVTITEEHTRQPIVQETLLAALAEAPTVDPDTPVDGITGQEPRIVDAAPRGHHRFSLRHLATALNLLPPDRASLQAITAALESHSSTDRTRAAQLLSRRGDREARQIVKHIMQSGSPTARASVIHEIHRFSWFVAQPLIRQALTDSDQRVRESAIYALCKMRLPEAYQLAEAVLRDAGDPMRLSAIWALNDGTDAAAENLSRLWDLKDTILQRTAAPGIGALPILEIALQAESPHVRIAALEALSATQIPAAMPIVQAVLDDPDPDVRYTAVIGMIELAADDCLPDLIQTLGSAPKEHSLPIVQGLFHATNMRMLDISSSPHAILVIDGLQPALNSPLPEVRIAAAMLLASIPHPHSHALLAEHYHREQDAEVKARIELAAQTFDVALEHGSGPHTDQT